MMLLMALGFILAMAVLLYCEEDDYDTREPALSPRRFYRERQLRAVRRWLW